MLNLNDGRVREYLLRGKIGLEKESLRVQEDGFFAQTKHPFEKDDSYVVRDFCENQTEINTTAADSVEEAMEQLKFHTCRIQKILAAQEKPEYLWPFSNPPYIMKEAEIPIAQYEDEEKHKQHYRDYLSERYGRYKMTFSGIHFNYSFSDELLWEGFLSEQRGQPSEGTSVGKSKGTGAEKSKDFKNAEFREYKNRFYVSLAAKAQIYNWLVVAATAASPLLDSSYVEKGVYGKDIFNGMGSTRCSELGYWNMFTPILDYSDLSHYVDSIVKYVKQGLIHSSAELYYPVRLKPVGKYDLEELKKNGVSHMELRMIDLNPLSQWGIEERDVHFIRLLLIYLASIPNLEAGPEEQVFAIQNTKNAAHYDLKTVNIITPDKRTLWAADAAIEVLLDMKEFYRRIYQSAGQDTEEEFWNEKTTMHPEEILKRIEELLDYQIAKFEDADNRYAWKVRRRFAGGFVKKGLQFCKESAKEE